MMIDKDGFLFSIMIFLINFILILTSSINIFIVLESVMFSFSVFCILMRLSCSYFSILRVSYCLGGSGSYVSLFTCRYVSNISRSQNQPFFNIIFACVANVQFLLNSADFMKFSFVAYGLSYICKPSFK